MVDTNTLQVTLNIDTFITFVYLFFFEIQASESFNCTLRHILNPCEVPVIEISNLNYTFLFLKVTYFCTDLLYYIIVTILGCLIEY